MTLETSVNYINLNDNINCTIQKTALEASTSRTWMDFWLN